MTAYTSCRDGRLPRAAGGFTLVEIAIGIALITLLLGSLLVPLQTQIESRKISDTEKILENAREALVGYAAANGRFPCPASSTSNGLESFAVGGSAVNGNCSNFFDGFLPAATLGSTPIDSSGYALDAWALSTNRIRYAVSNQTITTPLTVTNPFTANSTTTTGMKAATINSISAANLLYVCASGTGINAGTDCGTAVKLTSNTPIVIWSVGANGGTGGTSTDEAQNPNPNGGSADKIFVWHTPSTKSGAEFDDIMTWISVGTLASRMFAAGQLP